MPYVTKQDLINRFEEQELIQLTDHTNTGAINETVLNDAIADADYLADSYLQQRYTLPLAQAVIDASPLKRVCGDLVRYYLFENGATEEVERRHRSAISWLKDIALGKATLGEQESQTESSSLIKTAQGKSKTNLGAYG